MGSQANEVRTNQVDDPESKLADRLAMARAELCAKVGDGLNR